MRFHEFVRENEARYGAKIDPLLDIMTACVEANQDGDSQTRNALRWHWYQVQADILNLWHDLEEMSRFIPFPEEIAFETQADVDAILDRGGAALIALASINDNRTMYKANGDLAAAIRQYIRHIIAADIVAGRHVQCLHDRGELKGVPYVHHLRTFCDGVVHRPAQQPVGGAL